jgi:hypothetical protein
MPTVPPYLTDAATDSDKQGATTLPAETRDVSAVPCALAGIFPGRRRIVSPDCRPTAGGGLEYELHFAGRERGLVNEQSKVA